MEAGKQYHIYTHANGFENLFRSDENYRYFLERYEHFAPSVADTYAYCLMPNHIHFLVCIKTEKELLDFYSVKHPGKTLQGPKKTLEEFDEISTSRYSLVLQNKEESLQIEKLIELKTVQKLKEEKVKVFEKETNDKKRKHIQNTRLREMILCKSCLTKSKYLE